MLRFQTLNLFDRASERVPYMGQLRGHTDFDRRRHIRIGWMADDVQRQLSRSLQGEEEAQGAQCNKR